MDTDVVRNAVGGIDALLNKAKRALREMEYAQFGGSDDLGSYESPEDAMVYHFNKLYEQLLVVLEAGDLPAARADLIANWANFKKLAGGLRHTDQFGDFNHLTSPVVEYLDNLVSALQMTVSNNEIPSDERLTLANLQTMLRNTSVIVHRDGKPPSKESELQKIMHKYLRASFRGFTLKPQVNGALKNFKPDCGLLSVNAAIEFKIVREEKDAAIAFSGLVEDTGAYRGSKEWTRFFAVVYQAKPFIPDSELQEDMKRIKAGRWSVILVNGPMRRQGKAAKTSSNRKATMKTIANKNA
ncbi:MAG TPA: hypothetical protein VGN16_02990 [Acidobacteriaceae bacterium]